MTRAPDDIASGPPGRDKDPRRQPDGRSPRRALRRIGRTRLLVVLAVVGPGLISAASDNDAGGITTWSVIGARYGYSLLWLLLLITPILAVTQEMGARMGVVTGKGLAALIRERFSLRVTAFAMLALLVANFGTTIAEFSGVAAAFSLFHVPAWAAVPPVAAGVWLLVTRGSYQRVERVFLVLTAIYVAYIVAGFLARPDWHAAARGAAVPHVSTSSLWLLTVIAAIGTTITPWGQFFIQAYVVDKRIALRQYVYTKIEVYVGAVFTDLIDLFIVVACAATLYRAGTIVNTAEDAAQALRPLAGELAFVLFGFGLLNVSILGACILPLTTAYAVCEAFGFEAGLDRRFSEAPVFNGLLTFFIFVPALVAIIPQLPLVKVMLLSQDVNGILLPIILIYVLKIVNDRSVMGDHVNGPVYNTIAWAFSVVLIGLSAMLVVSPLVF
jgi:Mn2+/Fe2+ NRAMP family transporter